MQKNILCLLHLPPPMHGAGIAGQYIKESKLINQSFDCTFINLSSSQQLKEVGKIKYKKIFLIINILIKTISALIKTKYDICYITINAKGIGFYKEMVIVFLLKMLRYKIVYHYHNKGVMDNQNWFSDKLYRFQFKNSYVILLSPLLYPDVEKYIKKEKVFFCAYGIPDVCDTHIDLLNTIRKTNSVPKILFLSNMMEQKGVYILLKACKILLDRGVSYKTYFIGAPADVSETDFNNFTHNNNLQNNAIYVGKKYNEKKSIFYKQANIFAFPTFYHNETYGIVNLEAIQFGLPIISTNEGAIEDIVENGINGFIVPQKNTEALAEKLEHLINNLDICSEMGRIGRKKYEERYTLEIFEKNFIKILGLIIADK